MISLLVNGKPMEINRDISLKSFMEDLGVNMEFVAVAYNGNVLHKDEFDSVTLSTGDKLEIVRPVGGG